jgi:hypothetical protein
MGALVKEATADRMRARIKITFFSMSSAGDGYFGAG